MNMYNGMLYIKYEDISFDFYTYILHDLDKDIVRDVLTTLIDIEYKSFGEYMNDFFSLYNHLDNYTFYVKLQEERKITLY